MENDNLPNTPPGADDAPEHETANTEVPNNLAASPDAETGPDGGKKRKVPTVEELRATIPHDDPAMMDSLVAFLRKYLICDEHQLTILALWIVHTRTFQDNIATAAYLDIRSPEPECGKTRCLELLRFFCDAPWFASGPNPITVIEKLVEERDIEQIEAEEGYFGWPYSILLDDCHHIFGRAERQQQLLTMLNCGSRRNSRYRLGDIEYCVFRPMAFAGNAQLPRSLAARCIPIVLRRKKPTDIVARFHPDAPEREADDILHWLDIIGMWATWHNKMIHAAPPTLPEGWTLTAHEQDCAEPLLLIADAIGGPWPERARNAIITCSRFAECSPGIQVLADIRNSFLMNNNPEHLLTRDLLPNLRAMEHRPWAAWPAQSGRKLGQLLQPFGISSTKLTNGSEKGIMGYRFKDFEDVWERYLKPTPISEPAAEGVTPSPMPIEGDQNSVTSIAAASGSGA